MRRVFIPQLPMRYDGIIEQRVPSLNLTPAQAYGEVIVMSRPGEFPTFEDTLEAIKDHLAVSEPGDLLMCVGDVALTAAAMLYLHETHGHVKLLRWDRRDKDYEIEEVVL